MTTYTATDIAIMKAAFEVGQTQRALEEAERINKKAITRLRHLMDLKEAQDDHPVEQSGSKTDG